MPGPTPRLKKHGNYVQDPKCRGAMILTGTGSLNVTKKNSLMIDNHKDQIAQLQEAVLGLSKIVHHLLEEKGERDAR